MSEAVQVSMDARKAVADKLNTSVLLRQDPAFARVLGQSMHVAVYELDEANNGENRWHRIDVEGALFVYERNPVDEDDNPAKYRLIVINRKSPQNFLDFLGAGDQDIELSGHMNMITYRNADEEIKGLWFFEESDLSPIVDLIGAIMRGDTIPESSLRGDKSSPKSFAQALSQTGEDSKLAKKQSKNKRSRPPATIRTPVNVKVTGTTSIPVAKPPDNPSLLKFFPNLKTPESGIVGAAVPPHAQDSTVAENGASASASVASDDKIPNGKTSQSNGTGDATPFIDKSIVDAVKHTSGKSASAANVVKTESSSPLNPTDGPTRTPAGAGHASETATNSQEGRLQAELQAQARAQAHAQYQAQQAHAHHMRLQAHHHAQAQAQAREAHMRAQAQGIPVQGYGRPSTLGLQVPLPPMHGVIHSAPYQTHQVQQGRPVHQAHPHPINHHAHAAHMAFLAQQRALHQQYYGQQQNSSYSPPGSGNYMGNVPGAASHMGMMQQPHPDHYFNDVTNSMANMAINFGSTVDAGVGGNLAPSTEAVPSTLVQTDHMNVLAASNGGNADGEAREVLLGMLQTGAPNSVGGSGNAQQSTGVLKYVKSFEQSAGMIGSSMATLRIHGHSTQEDLKKNDFRSVIQRMLTDQKLFNTAYENYTAARAEQKKKRKNKQGQSVQK